MRAENVSEEMERIIIETLLSMRRSDYEPTAAEVRASVVRQLGKQGYTDYELPKLRTFQEYLRKARKRNLALKNASNVDESLPWNFQILNDKNYYISPETIPFVLQLWRYCKNLGPELTIRQAKWSARLFHSLKGLDIAEQWIKIISYSREEELSLLSETDMRIDQLNSLLVMEPWERMTLAETDNRFKVNRKLNHSFIHYSEDDGVVEEFYYALADNAKSYLDIYLEHKLPEDFERVNDLNNLISSLPSSSKYFPDYESRMVYLRHLATLSKLPYWRTAEPKQIYDLVVDLRNWVVAEANKKIKSTNNPQSDSLFAPPPSYVERFPLDIYERAGFSLEEDTKELETELRKLHPDWVEPEGGKQ